MAEAVGLALGVVSLAGLFGATVDAFDQIKAAKSFSKDYEFLTIRYDFRRVTLLQWGTAVGLSTGSKRARHPRLDHELSRPLVERALNCIRMLLTDIDGLSDKYGLQQVRAEDETDSEPDAVALLGTSFSRPRLKAFKSSYKHFLTNIKDRQKNTSLVRKSQWAIVGGREFRSLLRDLDDLINDLYKFIPVSLVKQMQLVEEDAAAVAKDPEQLGLLQEVLAEKEELDDVSKLSDDEDSIADLPGTAPPASFSSSAMASYRDQTSTKYASVASSRASWITALSYHENFLEEKTSVGSNNRYRMGQSSRGAAGASMYDSWDEHTAVQAATGCDQTEQVGRLVMTGADVDAALTGFFGYTPLQHAVRTGHVEMLKSPLAAEADVNDVLTFPMALLCR